MKYDEHELPEKPTTLPAALQPVHLDYTINMKTVTCAFAAVANLATLGFS